MENKNLALRNKSVLMKNNSRKSIRGLKTLGITKKTYYAEEEIKRARYKKVGDRMRERFRKSKGLRADGKKTKRRKKRKR